MLLKYEMEAGPDRIPPGPDPDRSPDFEKHCFSKK